MAAINQEKRDALYEWALEDLGRIDAWWFAIKEEDFEKAERLDREFSQVKRLIADLGWGYETTTDTYELTQPGDDLSEVLARFRDSAEAHIASEDREAAEERETALPYRERAMLVIRACDETAALVSAQGEDAAQAT